MGIVERIIDLYTRDKLNSEKIAKVLNDEGIKLSARAIRRTIKTSAEAAVQLRRHKKKVRSYSIASKTLLAPTLSMRLTNCWPVSWLITLKI